MNTKRLMRLIDFMDKLPRTTKKHFNMRWWFDHEGTHAHDFGAYVDRKALTHCGTVSCALGWASTIPSLKRAGLKVEATRQSAGPVKRAMRVFDLSRDQFDFLFTTGVWTEKPMNSVTTPKQWAKIARKLIKEWNTK